MATGRPSKGERVRVVTRLDAAALAKVDALATALGMDRSSALAEMVARYRDGAGVSVEVIAEAPPCQRLAVRQGVPTRRVVGFDARTGEPLYAPGKAG